MTQDVSSWIPAVTVQVFVVAIVWMAKSLIITRLTNSVRFEFDDKLEVLRSKLRKNEEELKFRLKSRDDEIKILKESVIMASIGRKQEIEKKKLEAIDEIWRTVNAFGALKVLSAFMNGIDFDAACELPPDSGIMRLMKAFEVEIKIEEINKGCRVNARPYVSPWIWAIYSSIISIYASAIMRCNVLLNGVNNPKLIKHEVIDDLLKTVVPQHSELIDEYSYRCYHSLLEDLENMLVDEMRDFINGKDVDASNVEAAAKVIRLSQEAMAQLGGIDPAQPC